MTTVVPASLDQARQTLASILISSGALQDVRDHRGARDLQVGGGRQASAFAHEHRGTGPNRLHYAAQLLDTGDVLRRRLKGERGASLEFHVRNAERYADGARTLAASMDELDQDFTDGLATCERDVILVSHAAFGYLAERLSP